MSETKTCRTPALPPSAAPAEETSSGGERCTAGGAIQPSPPWWKAATPEIPWVRLFGGDAYFDLRDRDTARLLAEKLHWGEVIPDLHPVEQLLVNVYDEGRLRGFAAGWNMASGDDEGVLRRLGLALRIVFRRRPRRPL